MIRLRRIIAGSINAPEAHKSNPYRSAPKVQYVQTGFEFQTFNQHKNPVSIFEFRVSNFPVLPVNLFHLIKHGSENPFVLFA